MKIDGQTLVVLAAIITGEGKTSPYRTGPQLVEFFNPFFEQKDTYGAGFPSRYSYAKEKLFQLDDSETLKTVIESTFDPRHFLGSDFSIDSVVADLNQYLELDGWQLSRVGKYFKLHQLAGSTVAVSRLDSKSDLSIENISENLKKADRKLQEGDYSGAITNARSLVETVLLEIEKRIEGQTSEFNGDIGKLFGRVQKHLELDPGRQDISAAVRQMVTGLISIVSGLAALRNKASDSHGSDFSPGPHHARLAVNAAKTICDFVTDEYKLKTSGK